MAPLVLRRIRELPSPESMYKPVLIRRAANGLGPPLRPRCSCDSDVATAVAASSQTVASQSPARVYPEPQNTISSTMVAPAFTEAPEAKLQRIPPVAAFSASIVGSAGSPAMELAYTTPLATDSGPRATAPFGSAVCHKIAPVAGSSADHEPPLPPACGMP